MDEEEYGGSTMEDMSTNEFSSTINNLRTFSVNKANNNNDFVAAGNEVIKNIVKKLFEN